MGRSLALCVQPIWLLGLRTRGVLGVQQALVQRVPLLVHECRLKAQADRQRELQEHRDRCRQQADQQVRLLVIFLILVSIKADGTPAMRFVNSSPATMCSPSPSPQQWLSCAGLEHV